MVDLSKNITGKARAVFSDAARVRLLTTDTPIVAVDPVSDCTLSYRFEHAGGILRITDGCLGRDVVAVGCDPDDLNLVATLLLDGLAMTRPDCASNPARDHRDWQEPNDEQLDPSPWSP
jgi:hypothetical protein